MNIQNLLPAHYIEHEFFGEIFRRLDRDLFHGITLYATHDYRSLPSVGDDVVVLLTAGDERGTIPAYSDRVLAVFKHHLDQDHIGNVYHLPLPYVNGFSGSADLPLRSRPTDVFFAGRNSRRSDMMQAVGELQAKRKDLRIVCYDTGTKFKRGWPIRTYSQEMSKAKIALSPMGAVRAECIRFTEAVKCGCAIIACRHPGLTCFMQTPAAYLDTWQDLEVAVDMLLEPVHLEVVDAGMRRAWEMFFSPAAQARKINEVILRGH